jgi:putative transcriptional regulator
MGSVKRATLKQASGLMQPKVGTLIYELRQLTKLTQVQLAGVLGVSYETINRWENGHIQPSPLALKQIQLFVNELSLSSSKVVQDKSKLLAAYFGEEQQ